MANSSHTDKANPEAPARKPQQKNPVPDSGIPKQFTRDPAEGSRETVQRNLNKKPS